MSALDASPFSLDFEPEEEPFVPAVPETIKEAGLSDAARFDLLRQLKRRY